MTYDGPLTHTDNGRYTYNMNEDKPWQAIDNMTGEVVGRFAESWQAQDKHPELSLSVIYRPGRKRVKRND